MPDVNTTLEGLGRRKIRTLVRDLDPDLDRERASELEDALKRLAASWRHSELLEPSFRAAYVAQQLAGDELAQVMRAFADVPHGPTATPGQRVVALTMAMLAAPLDLDGGPALSDLTRARRERAMVAWIVRRFGFAVGDYTPELAEEIWEGAQLDPAYWDARVERAAARYERQQYG